MDLAVAQRSACQSCSPLRDLLSIFARRHDELRTSSPELVHHTPYFRDDSWMFERRSARCKTGTGDPATSRITLTAHRLLGERGRAIYNAQAHPGVGGAASSRQPEGDSFPGCGDAEYKWKGQQGDEGCFLAGASRDLRRAAASETRQSRVQHPPEPEP
jgi:hypothetical protein